MADSKLEVDASREHDSRRDLLRKIESRACKVGVIGLGYVGLPFAVEQAKAGFSVVGIDQNSSRVAQVNSGQNYIGDVNDNELAELVATGRVRAVCDYDVVSELDIVVIAVPTPLTHNLIPDLRYVETVTEQVALRLRPGQLVSLESTTYPGTTEEVMLPRLMAGGLVPEEDFFLAYSPERVDPGNRQFGTSNTSKVIGGIGPASLEVANRFYEVAIPHVVPVSSARAAEFVKVFENTFRAVNIALVNELALLCDRMDLDIWEILDAAFTKPFGIMPFYPGPGVGGHCIPLDPHYLEWKAKEYNFNTRFINLAGEVNRAMPEFVAAKACRCLNSLGIAPSRAKVLVLGLSYKKDLDDDRESPAYEVIRNLLRAGVTVKYHDNHIPSATHPGFEMKSEPLTRPLLEETDLVIITTSHTTVDYQFVVDNARLVLDTRYATKNIIRGAERIVRL